VTQINIMFSRFSAFYSPLIATNAAGFLNEEGLEAKFSVAQSPQAARQGLEDGALQVIQSAVSSSWGPLERGQASDIVHFAQINGRDGFFVAARQSSPSFSWATLANRPVLVDHGGQPLAMFKYACHKMGLDYSQINAIDAGDSDAMEKAFRAGQGEYIHLQGPAPQQLEVDGAGYVVASVGEAIGPVAFSSLAATREWLQTDTARAFMRAFRKAKRYVIDTPAAEIAAAEAGYFNGITQEALTRTIAFYQKLGCWTYDVVVDPAGYEVALDVFLHSGLINKRHAYDAVVASPPA
jgi:NitT/TauT family transport system substrate-binding protein